VLRIGETDLVLEALGAPPRTVIGDAVNRASRYCDGAGGGAVLMSPAVHQRVGQLVEAEAVSVATTHEGQQPAYRVHRIPDDTTP